MWNYLELFYHQQGEENTGYVTERYLQELAQQVPGLNLATWTRDRSEPALRKLDHDRRAGGQQRGLHGHALVPDRQDRRHDAEARILAR